jgi:putative transposase
LATLEMAVTDKSRYANAVGAVSPWFQCGKMHQLVTDAGAAFRSRRFRFAALALGVNHEFPPGGFPELRSNIERMFGTFRTAIISRCTGQTFSNVVELGEYPAEERASLTVEQLSWILVRWVCCRPKRAPRGNHDRSVSAESLARASFRGENRPNTSHPARLRAHSFGRGQ